MRAAEPEKLEDLYFICGISGLRGGKLPILDARNRLCLRQTRKQEHDQSKQKLSQHVILPKIDQGSVRAGVFDFDQRGFDSVLRQSLAQAIYFIHLAVRPDAHPVPRAFFGQSDRFHARLHAE